MYGYSRLRKKIKPHWSLSCLQPRIFNLMKDNVLQGGRIYLPLKYLVLLAAEGKHLDLPEKKPNPGWILQAARLALSTWNSLAGCHSLRLSILLCHLALLDLALPGFASLAKRLNRIALWATDNVGKSPSAVSARAFRRGVPWDERPPAIWGLTRNAPFPVMEWPLHVFCQLSVQTLISLVFLACVRLMIPFNWIPYCEWMGRVMVCI